MSVPLLLVVLLGNALCSCAAAVAPRQASSALSPSLFLRRGYQSSEVLDNWLYIDGGEFSYSSNGESVFQYSSTLIAIDLSESWENSNVNLHSITKPTGAPDLVRGGVWVDDDNKVLYTGFAGSKSGFGDGANQTRGLWQFKPDGSGSGTWTNLNDTADSALQTQNRPESPLVASGGGAGYMLSGFLRRDGIGDSEPSTVRYSIGGLITYDYESKKVKNSTVSVLDGGQDVYGGMVYVSNFGEKGVLVALGGSQYGKTKADSDTLLDFQTVPVYDIASEKWYEQTTTGDVPESRKEFCVAGAESNNKTFEIVVYAGWAGSIGAAAIPYDEVFVLTLPGFHWVKASYNARSPRHGLSCNHVGGSQILTIGGLDTTAFGTSTISGYQAPFNTPDSYSQGLQVFDLTAMTFSSNYNATPGPYVQSKQVQNFYANNPRMPTFSDSGLQSVFSVQKFTNTSEPTASSTPSSSASPNASQSPSGESSTTNHTGAIVGGVVGGAVGLGLVGAVIWFFVRARTRKENRHQYQLAEAPNDHVVHRYEKPNDEVRNKPVQLPVPLAELPPEEQRPVELPGHPLGYK